MSGSTIGTQAALQANALRRVVRAEAWRRERIVNHFRFALFLLVGLSEWIARSDHDHTHLTAMPFVFLAWGVTIEVFNLTWFRKHFRDWIPAAITTIDIAVLTVAMRIVFAHAAQHGEETIREIDRAMFGLLVMVSVNAARFSWRTSVWSGLCALAALGYLRAYSNTMGNTAVLTDILSFAGVVALFIYANRSFRTVTERLLYDLRKAQEQRLASLRALVAGVSHEINSPLGAISGNAQIIERAARRLEEQVSEDEPAARRALEGIQRAGSESIQAIGRISSVVGALRDFSRLDDAEVRRVDLCESLDTCIRLLSTEAGDRIDFVRRCDEPLEITGRPAHLNQAFMHVLRNAVQGIDGRGTVTISGMREGDELRIEVADTGRGIPASKLSGIFELQFGRKGERVGIGLGLPVSHAIVSDHEGTIELRSSPGEGTTVTFRLPAG